MLTIGQERSLAIEVDREMRIDILSEWRASRGRRQQRRSSVASKRRQASGKNENDERRESRCVQRRAGGAYEIRVYEWDATTYKQVSAHENDMELARGADFSPDSIQLVQLVHQARARSSGPQTGAKSRTRLRQSSTRRRANRSRRPPVQVAVSSLTSGTVVQSTFS